MRQNSAATISHVAGCLFVLSQISYLTGSLPSPSLPCTARFRHPQHGLARLQETDGQITKYKVFCNPGFTLNGKSPEVVCIKGQLVTGPPICIRATRPKRHPKSSRKGKKVNEKANDPDYGDDYGLDYSQNYETESKVQKNSEKENDYGDFYDYNYDSVLKKDNSKGDSDITNTLDYDYSAKGDEDIDNDQDNILTQVNMKSDKSKEKF